MSSGKWWPLLIMVEPERNRSLPVIYKWPLIQTFILLKAFNGFFQGQPQLSYSSWLLTLHFLGLHTGGETLPFWWLSICIFRHLWDVILMCLAKISVLSLSQIWNIFFSRIGFHGCLLLSPFFTRCVTNSVGVILPKFFKHLIQSWCWPIRKLTLQKVNGGDQKSIHSTMCWRREKLRFCLLLMMEFESH